MDLGHWQYPGHFNPDDWFGFIYRVIDTTTGQQYIGKKQFQSTRRKVVKDRKNRKVVKSDSGWREYTSSSTHLNEAIETKGKDRFQFLIERLCKTKGALHYAEVEYQIYEDVMRARLPDGTRKFYNKMIANMRFTPPEPTADEIAHSVRQLTVNISTNTSHLHLSEMAEDQRRVWSAAYLCAHTDAQNSHIQSPTS